MLIYSQPWSNKAGDILLYQMTWKAYAGGYPSIPLAACLVRQYVGINNSCTYTCFTQFHLETCPPITEMGRVHVGNFSGNKIYSHFI